jgi:hypothetical protein
LRNAQDLDEDDKENEGRDDSFVTYGRQYARSGDIFTSIDDVVQFGVLRTVSDSDDEHELTSAYVLLFVYFPLDLLIPMLREKQRLESWELLCSRIPNFRSNMVVLASQRKLRRRVSRKVCPISVSLFDMPSLPL